MLADLVTKLVALGRETDAIRVVKDPAVPDKVWIQHGSESSVETVPPPRRAPSVVGIADLVAALKDGAIAPDPEVYYDERGVVAFLNRGDRRERLCMPFVKSERFKVLEQLARPQAFTSTQAVKLLRFELHGTGVETVIAALRRVDFTRKSDGSRVTEHGKESLGRAVEAAVQQAESIPEVFKVSTPIYANPGIKGLIADFRCGIYLDTAEEKIEIRLLSDELRRATDGVLEQIADSLRHMLGERVPVLYGSPGA